MSTVGFAHLNAYTYARTMYKKGESEGYQTITPQEINQIELITKRFPQRLIPHFIMARTIHVNLPKKTTQKIVTLNKALFHLNKVIEIAKGDEVSIKFKQKIEKQLVELASEGTKTLSEKKSKIIESKERKGVMSLLLSSFQQSKIDINTLEKVIKFHESNPIKYPLTHKKVEYLLLAIYYQDISDRKKFLPKAIQCLEKFLLARKESDFFTFYAYESLGENNLRLYNLETNSEKKKAYKLNALKAIEEALKIKGDRMVCPSLLYFYVIMQYKEILDSPDLNKDKLIKINEIIDSFIEEFSNEKDKYINLLKIKIYLCNKINVINLDAEDYASCIIYGDKLIEAINKLAELVPFDDQLFGLAMLKVFQFSYKALNKIK